MSLEDVVFVPKRLLVDRQGKVNWHDVGFPERRGIRDWIRGGAGPKCLSFFEFETLHHGKGTFDERPQEIRHPSGGIHGEI
jgi:hypothetical protein